MFEDLNLQPPIVAALSAMGIKTPTEVQSKVLASALANTDLQISAETGSGKTLAYLIPLMQKMTRHISKAQLGSRALILLPTRELAQQTFKQCDRIANYTKATSVLIIGGQESRYQASLLRRDPDVIVATPGRLIEHLNKGSALLENIEVLVLDEADRMLDMGFRDAVMDIIERCNQQRQTLLLSATLNHRGVGQIAKQVLNNPDIHHIADAQTKHENIQQKLVLSDNAEHKRRQLLWLLSNWQFDKAIVFANKRRHVTEIFEWLRSKDFRVNELHGEIRQDNRKRIMSMFNQGHFNVLVATDVAARGLDIAGVDLVVNFDMAHSGDEYVHRIGRTGRAGKQGSAVSLIADYEWNLTAGIQRYLHQQFAPFVIPGLEGKYKGPKKTNRSGKAVVKKTHKGKGKTLSKKTQIDAEAKPEKIRHSDKKNIGKRRKPSAANKALSNAEKAGLAPPKRQIPTD